MQYYMMSASLWFLQGNVIPVQYLINIYCTGLCYTSGF